jgi:hypothetical protein
MKTSATAASGRSAAGPAVPLASGFLKRLICLPCVFCGRYVELKREGSPAGPESFAVCQEDDAKLDAAIAALTADVLALLDGREARTAEGG